jgi:hypothetical protein
MRLYRRVLFAVVFVVTGAPHAHAHADMSKVTCGAFLASGKANMAAIIMWLRGYLASRQADRTGPCFTSRFGIVAGRVALPQSLLGIAHETVPVLR